MYLSVPATNSRAGEPRRPIALIASRNDAMGRALESIFEEDGYIPARIASLPRILELTRRANYDVIVLNQGLEEEEALQVSRALRDDPLFDHSIPVVITSAGFVSAGARMDAYRAGAWEFCSHPIDIDLVLIKLRTFLRSREEVNAARSENLIDARSGLYTPLGLQRVASTLAAGAARNHQPFACVAFSASPVEREVIGAPVAREPEVAFADVADVFRAQSRKSDVVGHMGPSRLAILAPDTDAAGARLLVARLQRELDKATANSAVPTRIQLRAGFSAVPDLATARLDVEELVHRAESALEYSASRPNGAPIISFDDLGQR
jgi:DNA-binding response OmpR family regulator